MNLKPPSSSAEIGISNSTSFQKYRFQYYLPICSYLPLPCHISSLGFSNTILIVFLIPGLLSFDPPISKAVRLCLWVLYFPWEGYQPIRKSPILGKELEISGIQDVRLKYKQNWINHLERMDNTRLPKHALSYQPRGRRDRGHPRKRWQCVDARTGQTT